MTRYGLTVGAAVLLLAAGSAAVAQDAGMFGNTPSRNMAADATGLPAAWDVTTGQNVLWSQPVGSQAYGGPVVGNGRVYVGTNNEGRRDPAIEGDKGVVMAFDAASGEYLWQMVHDKLPAGRVNDWPLQASAPPRTWRATASTTSRTRRTSSASMRTASRTARTTGRSRTRRTPPRRTATSSGHTT